MEGLKTDYYDIPTDGKETIDADHIAIKLDMNFPEGTILKSLIGAVRARKGTTRHSGTDRFRDLNKIIHYAKLLKKDFQDGGKDVC